MTLPAMSALLPFLVTVGAAPSPAAESTPGVDFPKVATVRLPECGTCTEGVAMVRIPPSLRSLDDPDDGSDLLLVDAEGAPVPFAVGHGEAPRELASVRVTDGVEAHTYTVHPTDRPIDGLEFALAGVPMVGRVTVRHATTGEVLGAPTLIWTREDSLFRRVDFDPVVAPLTVEISWLRQLPVRRPELTGLRRLSLSVEPDRVTVPVVHKRLSDGGETVYTLQLDSPMPVRAVDLGGASEAVVSRSVEVRNAPQSSLVEGDLLGTGQIQRVRLGESTLDAMTVPLERTPSADRLLVAVASIGQPILDLETMDLLLDGEAIWFQPTGPGPYTLYAGAPAQTRPPHELQLALPVLVRLTSTQGVVEAVQPNPDFQSPVLRSGLTDPGRLLPAPEAFSHIASVTGPTGMVRVPLGPEVQAASRRSLQDLRLTDASGAQLPHLLRRTGVDAVEAVALASVERVEEGGISRLIIPVPDPHVAVATVTLHTSAPSFSRTVTLLTPAGEALRPLRAVPWRGNVRPDTLGIALDQIVGDQLVVEIDNGDDPPLPITGIDLSRPGWELVTVLPEAGATLHVGDPRRPAPEFDLQLYADDLSSRAVEEATVGSLEEQTPPPLSFVDRAALMAGLGVLVLGLAGLTLRLLRRVPPSDEPPAPPSAEGTNGGDAPTGRPELPSETATGEAARA